MEPPKKPKRVFRPSQRCMECTIRRVACDKEMPRCTGCLARGDKCSRQSVEEQKRLFQHAVSGADPGRLMQDKQQLLEENQNLKEKNRELEEENAKLRRRVLELENEKLKKKNRELEGKNLELEGKVLQLEERRLP
ncbi:hypothetical protein BT69DRAFT_1288555, partial [Atractiella rhizophila]